MEQHSWARHAVPLQIQQAHGHQPSAFSGQFRVYSWKFIVTLSALPS